MALCCILSNLDPRTHPVYYTGTFRLDTPVFNFGYDHKQQIVSRSVRDKDSRMFVAVEGEEDDAEPLHPGEQRCVLHCVMPVTSGLSCVSYVHYAM